MADPRWLNQREDSAWRGLHAMNRALDGALSGRLLADSGLSMADYELLVPLSEAPDRRLRARDLGTAVQWEKSRLSKHVSRMQQRGLVVRETCPTDKRGLFIRLTELGWQAMTSAAPDHVAAVREYFIDPLTDEELLALSEICDRVVEAVRAQSPAEDPC